MWASLFSDGFVAYRKSNNIRHQDASMAILLQKYISPKAAGVVFSRHPETQRPVYNYTANPGSGEIVVDGRGNSDTWLVGLNGTEILERWINRKTVKKVDSEEGGTREEIIDMDKPTLKDGKILELSQVVKQLHHYYRDNDLAQDIDIEYVFDNKCTAYIVQARSQSSSDMEGQEQAGLVIHEFLAVDELNVPDDTPQVQLASGLQVAYTGAVTGELQIIIEGGPTSAKPGAIVVTHHTNNDWNSIFSILSGLITIDGTSTSHAGQHAQEKRIPCVVGVNGAMETLMEYDGKIVTLDTDKGIVYLGAMPIIKESRSLHMWVTNPEKWKEIEGQRIDNELFRNWEETMEKRPKVYLKDFEGQWRRHSNYYGYFELDYYYKAWDRLTEILNKKFQNRCPFVLKTQEREFKIKMYLFSWDEIPGNDDQRIIKYLKDELKIEWAKTENIGKIDDGKTIIVSNKENSLSLKLNDEKTKVNLKIDDDRVDEFTVKTENGKLNIYSKIKSRRCLFHRVEVIDQKSIFNFINGVKNIDIEDMQGLFDMRWQGFEEMASCMEKIEDINAKNVEKLVDNLVEVFAWMHMGFWLDAIVENTVVNDQLKYIDKEYHDVLRNVAVEDLPREESIHPNRADIPGGKVLNLTSNKDKEIYAVLEHIRSDVMLVNTFSKDNIEDIKSDLNTNFVYNIIDGWSKKYKCTSEDIMLPSDTDEYIIDIKGRLKEADELDLYLLANFCRRYQAECQKNSLELNEIEKNDNDLYILIIGYARRMAAEKNQKNKWEEIPRPERAKALLEVKKEDLNAELTQAINKIKNELIAKEDMRNTAKKMRNMAKRMLKAFPRLKQTLALSKMQLALREDGHHLVVPFQRKIARMMCDLANNHLAILEKPENIFQISTDELIALVKEKNPFYIKKTFDCWAILDEAEKKMNAEWNNDSRKAVEDFEYEVNQAIQILKDQAKQTDTQRVEESYQNEEKRLRHRIKRLKNVQKGTV